VCIEAAIGDHAKQQQRRPGGLKRKRGLDEGYGDDQDDDSQANQAAVDSLPPVVADSAFASGDEDVLLPQQLSRLRQLVPGLTADSRVVIIVCGGSNVTTGMVSQWREDLDSGWV
jgi:L-serine/L-threonine ammonia-lyase